MHSMTMMNNLGIYIHIPFCKRKCPYCDFYSLAESEDIKADYVSALIKHIRSFKDKALTADTVYFGGGTPTALDASQLADILSAVKDSFTLTQDCEITTEANPCTVDFDYLKKLYDSGFNRISFGVQSAQENELSSLGRLHTFGQAENAVISAQSAGFDNISCDLMIGIPGQTQDSLCDSIDKLSALGITHISAYMLKIEKGTAFDCDAIRQSVANDDEAADLYLKAVEKLSSNGFEQYEISNFCRRSRISKHNYKYWILSDYLGFGPCAHSYFEGKRFFFERDISGYIKNPDSVLRIEDDNPDKLCEYTMLSLRLSSGISRDEFIMLGGNPDRFDKVSKMLVCASLAEYTDSGVRLTPQGFLLSNSIILKFLD